ncbi:MAG TPA: hypothetical protein VE172_02760 [Stackebrandtia sp.]|jgi:hypothetical protein|uniref:ATP-grasp domain-containing protein n=1 Tax=Stackebrandtia sp. TaxID=2023065 RepID=UPI002D4BF20B|nr:hypothetical protein [Stackebrandtia sp.]HZE37708.1 hypothetical protein [Stackebrandtia sp.]
MSTVALVTCSALPTLDPDETLLLDPLSDLGVTGVPAVWNDPSVDWDSFDATVIRCPWDYQDRRARFLAWARAVPRLYNPAKLVEWNTDKRYLGELAAAGVPVVPTTWLPPGTRVDLPEAGEWVLKPSVGAGSRDAGRYIMDDYGQGELAAAHVARLHEAGTTVMAQPYLHDVDANGERALIYIDGELSHTVRKSAMLDGPYEGDVGLYKDEIILPSRATDAERALGAAAMEAVGGDGAPLYARVDVIGDGDDLLLLELELAEPSLFFSHDDAAAGRMARAIAARV